MILVGQFDSFPTRRVAVALHHYGIAFDRDTSSVFGDADHIRRINPLTRIPSLILDDGEVLIESAAILDFLDEVVGPELALVPRAGPLRRKILQAAALGMGAGEKAVQIVYEQFFHPAAALSSAWLDRCFTQLGAALAEMERRCEAPWFCGNSFSHADISATCTVGYLRLRVPEAFPPGTCPRLEALAERCEALEVFRAAAIGANEQMPSKGQ